MFAYGMMMYQLLTGKHPFENDLDKPSIVEYKIRQNERPSLPTGQSLVRLQSLINRCWRYWPRDRPSASQIVAEMCEPTFHLRCKDLVLNASYVVLATAVMTGLDDREIALLDRSAFDPAIDKDQNTSATAIRRPRSSTSSLNSGRPAGKKQRSMTTSCIPGRRTEDSFAVDLMETTAVSSLGSAEVASSFSHEMFTHIENAMDSVNAKQQNRSSTVSNRSDDRSSLFPSEDEPEREPSNTHSDSYAVIVTADLLLIADPRVSRFVCAQRPETPLGDVSCSMVLKDRLWLGLRSHQLCVFELFGGDVVHPIKQQTFSCNDVVKDIQFHPSSDRNNAKIFALVDNGEVVVIQGHMHGKQSVTEIKNHRRLNDWGSDALYQWDQPRVVTLGTDSGVTSEIVGTGPAEIWYCQGNTIGVVKTDADVDDWHSVTFAIDGIGTIHDPVVLADSVWCCDSESSPKIYEIDIASRALKRTLNIQELQVSKEKQSQSMKEATDSECYRKERQRFLKRVAITPFAQSLTVVYDTLWVACNNGAILVLGRISEQKLRLQATLWCHSALSLDHVSSQETLMAIAEMKQIDDRVLVYRRTNPGDEEQTIVAEVFQALNSSQLEELTTYFNAEDA